MSTQTCEPKALKPCSDCISKLVISYIHKLFREDIYIIYTHLYIYICIYIYICSSISSSGLFHHLYTYTSIRHLPEADHGGSREAGA